MHKRDLIIQFLISIFICTLLSFAFESFEYSKRGAIYVGINLRNTIPYLFYFIGTGIFSLFFGLFMRLNDKIKNWLRHNFWLNLICCLIGIISCFYSMKNSNIVADKYRMDGMDFEYWHPKSSFQVIGWCIVIFSTLNIYLPNKKRTIKQIDNSY